MLKQRIITAITLVTLLVILYFFLTPMQFTYFLSLFVLIGAWEWSSLIGWREKWKRTLYVAAVACISYVGLVVTVGKSGTLFTITLMAALWWLYALVELREGAILFRSKTMKAVSGLLVLAPVWWCAGYFLLAGSKNHQFLLYVVVLVAVADTAAYFSGRALGRHKLAPNVSPGKTIEGAIGGLSGVILLAILFGVFVWDMKFTDVLLLSLLSVITGCFSIIGDLFESKLKRSMSVKDSGNILPGHGGVLDRMDAMTAALPVFTFGWIILSRINQ